MKYLRITFQILKAPVIWFVYFISGFFKRDHSIILFGTHTSTPAGNILAHYHEVRNKLEGKYEMHWIVCDKNELKKYKALGLPALNKYSIKGILKCLKGRYYCFSQHINDISFAFSRNAFKINLWHGTPIKKIEADIDTGVYAVRYKYSFLFRLIQPWVFDKFDKIFCSCQHDCNVFSSAFKINDQLKFYKTLSPRLIPLKKIDFIKNNTIIIAPTFRDKGGFNYSDIFNFTELSALANDLSLKIKIKLHPADVSLIDVPEEITNIEIVDKNINFYDLLPDAKLIITDYSSVFFDAFSLELPVVFYWPDYNEFITTSRDFYLKINEVCPELVSYNMDELKTIVYSLLTENQRMKLDIFTPYNISKDYPYELYKL